MPVLSCPQQTTGAAIILIAGKTKIRERRKQSKRGAQVSFLCLAFTFMAFPAESEYNEGKGLMILATLHMKLPPTKPGDERRSNVKQREAASHQQGRLHPWKHHLHQYDGGCHPKVISSRGFAHRWVGQGWEVATGHALHTGILYTPQYRIQRHRAGLEEWLGHVCREDEGYSKSRWKAHNQGKGTVILPHALTKLISYRPMKQLKHKMQLQMTILMHLERRRRR